MFLKKHYSNEIMSKFLANQAINSLICKISTIDIYYSALVYVLKQKTVKFEWCLWCTYVTFYGKSTKLAFKMPQ